jgi:truncated hemoglobin YjbI
VASLCNGPVETLDSLFARIGGLPAIRQVTTDFYAAVLGDPLLAPLFGGVDMAKLTGMQVAFLSVAFGGPGGYAGRDLRTAHAGLELTDEHFDRVVALLAGALKDADVNDQDVAAVAAVAETVRADVLGR